MNLRWLGALAVAGLLTACTPMPQLNFTPQDIVFSSDKLDAALNSVSVSMAQENERLGALTVGFSGNVYENSFRTTFKESIQEALLRSGLFSPNSLQKVAVYAKIYQFETNSDFNFTTKMIVDYTIQDLTDGKIIFEKRIESTGKVPSTYAFAAIVRYAEARNRSAQNNITNFISALRVIATEQTLKREAQAAEAQSSEAPDIRETTNRK